VLEETALGVLLLGAFLILVVMSFVFAYHWKRFGVPTPLFHRMRRLYFAVSAVLASLSIALYIFILISP
jgi:hypothetical protein